MAFLVDFEIPNFIVGVLQANADLSAKQYYCVDVKQATGSGLSGPSVDLPAASGANVIGLLQNKPILGEAANVMCAGISKGFLGGTVAVGDSLMTDSAGKLIVATSGNYQVARALDAGVSGDICAVLLQRAGKA